MTKVGKTVLIAGVILVGAIGFIIWDKLYRVQAQPAWIAADPHDTYFYGSVGARHTGGVPYWLWLAMPRIFPEHMPGLGGYASVGMSWEEGKEMPVGFAKQRVGYIRVTGNCALCHVVSQSNGPDRAPSIVAALPDRTTDITPFVTFWKAFAADSRFNADEFFSEIDSDTKLSLLDRLLYRYVFIPRTKRMLMNNPEQALLSPELREHLRNPHSEAPFADRQMKLLREHFTEQSQ